jgi:hypothetical protein
MTPWRNSLVILPFVVDILRVASLVFAHCSSFLLLQMREKDDGAAKKD